MKKIIWIISCSALLFSCIGKDAKTVNAEERTTDLPTPITEPQKEAVEEEEAPETKKKIKKLVEEASKNAKAVDRKQEEITPAAEILPKKPEKTDFGSPGNDKTEFKKTEPILTAKAKAAEEKTSHSDWNRLMNNYVSADGKVNYSGLKTEKAAIDKYMADLKATAPTSDWSKQEAMAYWINLYNAFTISLIVEKYPNINGIMDLDAGKVWKTRTITVAGTAYTLDRIENEMLLKKYKEPRIHFALNCAAKSCPPLLNAAWTKDNIEEKLEAQTKKFINNRSFNTISTKSIEISKIFEWYASDFGNLIDYLNKYSTLKIEAKAKIKYSEYDWGLNKN